MRIHGLRISRATSETPQTRHDRFQLAPERAQELSQKESSFRERYMGDLLKAHFIPNNTIYRFSGFLSEYVTVRRAALSSRGFLCPSLGVLVERTACYAAFEARAVRS
jgi:hypothetical protein